MVSISAISSLLCDHVPYAGATFPICFCFSVVFYTCKRSYGMIALPKQLENILFQSNFFFSFA